MPVYEILCYPPDGGGTIRIRARSAVGAAKQLLNSPLSADLSDAAMAARDGHLFISVRIAPEGTPPTPKGMPDG